MNIQRVQITMCRFCRFSVNHRRSFVTKLIADWKEMLRNSEPRPDPPGMKPPVFTFKKWFSLPLRSHWLIIQETLMLYKQTVFDRNAAISSLTVDEELLKAVDDAAAAAAAAKSGNTEGGIIKPAQKIDVAEFLEQLKQRNPQLFESVKKIQGVEDVVQLMKDNKGEVQKVAVDRMEVMGEAIREFMVGYREGKDAGYNEALQDEKLLERMLTTDQLNSSNSNSSGGSSSSGLGGSETIGSPSADSTGSDSSSQSISTDSSSSGDSASVGSSSNRNGSNSSDGDSSGINSGGSSRITKGN